VRDLVLDLVTRHLKHPLRPSGNGNYLTKCPFHKGGEEKKPSFSINPDKGLFNCFTCHLAGDVEYMLKLVGLPTFQIEHEIKNIKPLLQKNRELMQYQKEHTFSTGENPFLAPVVLPEQLLGVYEWMPTSLVEKGFDPAVLQSMEVGFDRNQQRITYPIRDLEGNLAGMSAGATQPWQVPKYKVYQGAQKDEKGVRHTGDFGERFDENYPGYTFENHNYLWNFHRVFKRLAGMSDPSSSLFVVEGFKACLWMVQAGYWNTVALMGSYISERQVQTLSLLNTTVYLFLDNDEAGKRATIWVGELLWKKMYGKVRVIPYPMEDAGEDTQPDDYELAGIPTFVQRHQSFMEYQLAVMQSNPALREKISKRRRSKWQ
jgi:DNA primase